MGGVVARLQLVGPLQGAVGVLETYKETVSYSSWLYKERHSALKGTGWLGPGEGAVGGTGNRGKSYGSFATLMW